MQIALASFFRCFHPRVREAIQYMILLKPVVRDKQSKWSILLSFAPRSFLRQFLVCTSCRSFSSLLCHPKVFFITCLTSCHFFFLLLRLLFVPPRFLRQFPVCTSCLLLSLHVFLGDTSCTPLAALSLSFCATAKFSSITCPCSSCRFFFFFVCSLSLQVF